MNSMYLNVRPNAARIYFDAPYLLLCLFIFSIPFETPFQLIGKELTAFPLIGLMVFAMWFGSIVIHKSKIKRFRGQGLLAAIVGCYLLSSAAHGFQYSDIRAIITIFQLAIMVILIVNLCTSLKKTVFLGKVIFISCTVNSILSIYFGFEGEYIAIAQGTERFYGLSTAVPRLALYSATGAIFGFFNLMDLGNRQQRILVLVCIAVNLFSLLLTISLIVGFALLLSAMVWLLISSQKARLPFIKRTALFSLFGFIMMVILSNPAFQNTNIYRRGFNRLEQIRYSSYADWGSQRVGAWVGSVQVIMENPIFGVGKSEVPYAIAGFFPGVYRSYRLGSHNFLLGLATEFGLLTMVPFLLMIAVILLRLYRTISRLPKEWNPRFRHIGDSLFVSFVFIIGCGMGLDYQRHKYLWIIMALSIAYTSLIKKQAGGREKHR